MITDTITEEARDQIRQMQGEIERLTKQLVSARELSEAQLQAGAQALANDVWHPPQKWESLPPSDQNKFRRQALLALKAALTLLLTR